MNSASRPMLWAFIAAVVVHVALLFGVGFRLPEPAAPNRGSLEVMLVKQTAPLPALLDPDSVNAQADRAGETLAPLPELDEPEPAPFVEDGGPALDDAGQTAYESKPPLEPASQQPLADLIPKPAARPPALLNRELTPPVAEAVPMVSAADILASRGDEIERLTARISAQSQAYQRRARRKAISTSTREYRYAAYMEAWRRKVERIGNLNYPQEAKEQGLYGNLILHVAVRADGSLEAIRVVHSSGQELLDQAAIRIVELAAPFAAFPPDIAAETDVLDITRTWQFQRNNRLGWDR